MCITLHFSELKHKSHLLDHRDLAAQILLKCNTVIYTMLHSPDYSLVSSASISIQVVIQSGILFINTENKGPTTDPCGSPLITSVQLDCEPQTLMRIYRLLDIPLLAMPSKFIYPIIQCPSVPDRKYKVGIQTIFLMTSQ